MGAEDFIRIDHFKMAGSTSKRLLNTAKSIASVASWIYLIILLATAIPFEVISLDMKKNELSTFSCMRDNEKCCAERCLVYYNNEIDHFQEWIYHAYLIFPSFIWIYDAMFRMRKACRYPNITCKFHIHWAYFLKSIFLMTAHLLLLAAVAVDFKDLEVESRYNCTVYSAICIDEKAAKKSLINVFLFICTIFLSVYVLVELVVFAWSWKEAKQELTEQVEDRYHCKSCCLFLEKFYNGMIFQTMRHLLLYVILTYWTSC